jgi:hypothetical protein
MFDVIVSLVMIFIAGAAFLWPIVPFIREVRRAARFVEVKGYPRCAWCDKSCGRTDRCPRILDEP